MWAEWVELSSAVDKFNMSLPDSHMVHSLALYMVHCLVGCRSCELHLRNPQEGEGCTLFSKWFSQRQAHASLVSTLQAVAGDTQARPDLCGGTIM